MYWERGWRGGEVPVPPGTKQPALRGVTGYDGVDLSYPDVLQLIETMPDYNIALRLPDNKVYAVIGIDVDHYDDKRGGDTLAHAESLWGKLPYSPRSTSRIDDPISGIRLFLVPPGLHWKSVIEFPDLGLGDIEIIQRTHRIVVCWPSIHSKTGLTYHWIDDHGNHVEIPRPEDLPELPAKWVAGLYETSTRRSATAASTTAASAEIGDLSCYRTDGAPQGRVMYRLKIALADLLGPSRYDHTLRSVLALLRFGKDGDAGVDLALDQLRAEYIDAIGLSGARTYAAAAIEFDRMITNPGAAQLLAEPSHPDLFAINGTAQAAGSGETSEENDVNDQDFDGEPVPMTTATVDVPPFPVDALPTVIANKVRELAVATQTDPAMAGTSALSVASACCGGHAEIEIRPGWVEPLNLFTGTIAVPGERKSAVQMSMLRPIIDAQGAMSFVGEIERLEKQDEAEMAKKTVDKLNKAAVDAAVKALDPKLNAKDKKDAEEAREKAAAAARKAKEEARSIDVPPVPRLLADDCTLEATAALLAEHGGRIAIISAEGGVFDTIAGRYSSKVNLDVYLKGHAGDPITVDRISRPPVHIPRPALTVGLMFQPRVLEAIASNRDFSGRGLLARFMYSRPASNVGQRDIDAPPVNATTEAQYTDDIKKLASEMAGWAGDPAKLTLSPEAKEVFRAIEQTIEISLGGGGELASPSTLCEWGAKYAGAVARITGLLHLAEHGAGAVRTYSQIQPKTIKAAELIGEYFKANAVNTFAEMHTDADTADAKYLLGRALSLGRDTVSTRELFTAATRARFATVQDMMPALKRLIAHGYLLQLDSKPTGGRPASPSFKIHPHAAKDAEDAKGSE